MSTVPSLFSAHRLPLSLKKLGTWVRKRIKPTCHNMFLRLKEIKDWVLKHKHSKKFYTFRMKRNKPNQTLMGTTLSGRHQTPRGKNNCLNQMNSSRRIVEMRRTQEFLCKLKGERKPVRAAHLNYIANNSDQFKGYSTSFRIILSNNSKGSLRFSILASPQNTANGTCAQVACIWYEYQDNWR